MVKYGVKDCQKSLVVCHFVCQQTAEWLPFGIKDVIPKRYGQKNPLAKQRGDISNFNIEFYSSFTPLISAI